MKHYEIRELNHPDSVFGFKSTVIDEDELDRRLVIAINSEATLLERRNMLLQGKFKEAPDPWEEWAEETAKNVFAYDGNHESLKAALLKLRDLVERKGGC